MYVCMYIRMQARASTRLHAAQQGLKSAAYHWYVTWYLATKGTEKRPGGNFRGQMPSCRGQDRPPPALQRYLDARALLPKLFPAHVARSLCQRPLHLELLANCCMYVCVYVCTEFIYVYVYTYVCMYAQKSHWPFALFWPAFPRNSHSFSQLTSLATVIMQRKTLMLQIDIVGLFQS